ncbi:MAG: asparagine synthase (glutamine-hydrolyzing) [Nitrospiraceae bacterium]|nr:MAG: asparagine synthase (glutamine-hydrolyzing) [Nitrospiraceae bacterium]
MCGIFGFFSENGKITTKELHMSLKALHHRGPDNAGVVTFTNSPLNKGHRGGAQYFSAASMPDGEWSSVLAHTRLSIIDLSEAASQPMCNEDCPECNRRNGTVRISYNGEIYNFREIRHELLAKGHSFKSKSDTEVIIHGYEEWGIDVINKLRGMFAFALLDKKSNKLFLVRDRLGVKPLKYFYDRDTFIFASELKGFMHLIPRRLDPGSLDRFLTLKYVPSPGTILDGVRKLSPAEYLEFDMSTRQIRKEIYWRPSFFPKSSFSFPEAKEGLKKIFSEAVFMRTISDVPIGVYLSGGMDSSAMVAFLKDNGVNNINTFTIKFDRPGYDESEYARAVANRFRTTHHEFQTPELTYNDLQEIINSLDEPFGDPSYIPTYYLSKYTSEHVKVILSGDGGDELLGGYKRYYIHARGRILGFLPQIRTDLLKKLPPQINKKKFIGKLQRIAEDLAAGFWGAYLKRFNGFSDTFKRYVMVPGFYDKLDNFTLEDLVDGLDDFNKISDTIERLIWIDMHTYLPDYILTKTDLALMAHSVEGRNPFVDYRLVEFCNALPPEYKFKESGKYILKTILEEYVPREIIHRKKMGFSPPIKYWFKGNPALLYGIFSKEDFVSGDIFDLKRVHRIIDEFTTTDMNVSEQLWLMIVLELWRRTYRV